MVAVAIDIHMHLVPFYFPAYGGTHAKARLPLMQAADFGHRSVMIDGMVFRTVSRRSI
jgi:aminocarboxymuconate-semialdehyde decarboxylase